MIDGDTKFEKMDACDKKATPASGLFGWFWGNTTETESAVVAKEDEAQPRKLLKRIGGGAKAAQTKLGKGVLVVVASALLGVALLPF